MMKRRNQRSNSVSRLALSAMLSALGVVLLFLGSIIEVMDLTAVAVASFLTLFALIEMGGGYPYLIWLATSCLSLLLLPDKFAALTYFLIGGIYPMIKRFAERCRVPIAWAIKILFFNAVLSAVIAVSLELIGTSSEDIGFTPVIYLLGNLSLILYDIAITKLIIRYHVTWRKRLGIEKLHLR